jgi:hypothetical protein
MMMKILSIFLFSALLSVLFVQCSGENQAEPIQEKAEKPVKNKPFDQRYKSEIEAKLKIDKKEKYTYQVYKALINADIIEDAIITVNRMQFAEDEAIKSGKVAKSAEMGYVGNYNYFFYYDGAIDEISEPIVVPSSPGRALDVSFASITSTDKQDIIIDYRIRNSGWRSYFTSTTEGHLSLMFQWKWFDYIGESTPEALNHVFEMSPEGRSQDISIYQSAIDDYTPNVKDVYAYAPKITKKGALMYRFFYDPAVTKFRIYSPQMLRDMGLTAVGPLTR